jgi:uncharacterized protein YbjQ (UPF0145 family)
MAFVPDIPIYTIKLMNRDATLIPLGVVVGNDRERVSFFRKMGDDFMSLFGGSSGLMRKKMNDLIKNAKSELQQNVRNQFPNATAVYDAEFNFNTGNRYFEVVITGTAVIEKDKLPDYTSRSSSRRSPRTPKAKAKADRTRRRHRSY